MKARAHLYINGKVQGVYYRAFACDVASSLELKGWARNLQDGRVEIVFEGNKDTIELAIKKCYEGPPASKVTDIDISWENHLEGFNDFMIRY